jgi:ferredoxin-NADP reductase
MSCSFYLVPVDGRPLPPFKPGQFLTFSIPIAGQRPAVRCYSLSEEPRNDRYRITVKRALAPDGHPELAPGICSNELHDRVQVGDVLRVKAPNGQFVVDTAFPGSTVLVGGGVGITPLLCMLKALLAEHSERRIYLFYGVRNAREHAFKSVLEKLVADHPTLRLTTAYSRPEKDCVPGRDYQHQGHIDIDLLRSMLPFGDAQFYVCGPPAMMASLLPALKTWGVPDKYIHFEAFGPASSPALANTGLPGSAPLFHVRWNRSGRTLMWDGADANLLAFAERNNIPIDSGCRSGSCGSCETKIISGTVSYASEPDYPVAHGYCLLCVGRPGSDLALEA